MGDNTITKNCANYKTVLLAGSAAGTAVDACLFPLDTIKTRLQSQAGFRGSGAFRGLYSGLLSVLLGSAPSAAVFFVAYETTKELLGPNHLSWSAYQTANHVMAASLGDVTSCLIRVPVEIVKQRTQTGSASSSYSTFISTYQADGLCGFYRGYFSMIAREIPFSVIQFPLWEFLKQKCFERSGQSVTAAQSSACAAVAGGVAAALTTPLDVVKTRIMLAPKGTEEASGNVWPVIQSLLREKGIAGLFVGFIPRMWLMAVGGAIFLGVYDKTKLFVASIDS